MPYDRNRHHRRSIRLRGWDYSSPAFYFVTVVARARGPRESRPDGHWFDNPGFRTIVQREWAALPGRFPTVRLDAFVVMPNHVHFVLRLTTTGGDGPATGPPHRDGSGGAGEPFRIDAQPASLGQVVRAFKAVVSRRIRQAGGDAFAWQRNYYERIVRNRRELCAVRRYIRDNPAHWAQDRENPDRLDW